MSGRRVLTALTGIVLSGAPVAAQAHPDLSGVWRLDPTRSEMIGGGG